MNMWRKYGDHTPQTITRDNQPYLYLAPFPQDKLDGMEMMMQKKTPINTRLLRLVITCSIFKSVKLYDAFFIRSTMNSSQVIEFTNSPADKNRKGNAD
jgi:hypothetical protein